jgi:hypothetical protein
MAEITNTIEVNAFDAMKNLCIRLVVINTGALKLRIAIGSFLVRVAGRVMGCAVEVEVVDCTVFSRDTLAAIAESKAAGERFKKSIEKFGADHESR